MENTLVKTSEKNNSEKPPLESDNLPIFEMYKLWKTLPIQHMLLTSKGVTIDTILDELGIEDELLREVMQFKRQNDWANRFNLHINTISRWNSKIGDSDAMKEAKAWLQPLTKNVMFNIYRRAATGSDPFVMKLYLQTVQDWQEKNTVNIHVPDVQIVFGSMGKDRKQVKPEEPIVAKAIEIKTKQPDATTTG